MRKISYCITVWGGCSEELIRGIQVCQNRAARAITRNDWPVGTGENLRQLGWLSVKQTVFYFSALLMYKIRSQRLPESLACMFDWTYSARLSLSKDSFRWRNCATIGLFKSKLRQWIRDNIKQK